MKYVSPEMEIVEFDETILTEGLNSQKQDGMDPEQGGGGTFPNLNGGTFY